MGYNIDHAPAQFDSHEMICVVGASITVAFQRASPTDSPNRTRHPDLASRTKNRGPADPPPDSPKRLRVVPTRQNPPTLASLS
ncbi:hypothetical protein PCANC_17020 [Puccinia coronata f. sp. avenae]|uniref:Uncharacterized protein n=1 Tax=Puccinia coronata f. sp. avenae TaxID=200324 RepID=A0A2N5SG29_9BASI|nr:hypothetical protein PCANC_17020 [Puccinia coronata f. sp. avenae]